MQNIYKDRHLNQQKKEQQELKIKGELSKTSGRGASRFPSALSEFRNLELSPMKEEDFYQIKSANRIVHQL